MMFSQKYLKTEKHWLCDYLEIIWALVNLVKYNTLIARSFY